MYKQGWKVPLGVFVFILSIKPLIAQYAPQAGINGTTAIGKDSSAFVEWATGCVVQRGPENIADTSLGYASAGDTLYALGQADRMMVSLGDGGIATLTFDDPVYNGPGFDFAVFENGFLTNNSDLAFLELGFVEVSSDGINFFRFPAVTEVQDTNQLNNAGSIDCSQLYDFAGKYIGGYGTPFDLDEMKNISGLDVNNITHIRVIDVVGSLDSLYATHDANGRKVNDPWPTPFASCGFDLDAVGVINAKGVTGIPEVTDEPVKIYPDPAKAGQEVRVRLNKDDAEVIVSDLNGRQLFYATGDKLLSINTSGLSAGVYLVSIQNTFYKSNLKLVVE